MARHPENAPAHFALAYVLRYGGAIEESARECDTTLSLDPGNFQYRSCAMTFDQLGNYKRAWDFLQLDVGSAWASDHITRQYLREGKVAQAREEIQKDSYKPFAEMMTACIHGAPAADTAKAALELSKVWLADPDPEVRYWDASNLAYCGHPDLAMNLLKTAIVHGHYCASDGLQNEGFFAALRGTPEFAQLLSAAKQCQADFLSQRERASP